MSEDRRYVPDARARWAMVVAALALGWISARAAIQSSGLDSEPQVAALFSPVGGQALAGHARERVTAASGEIDDTTRSLIKEALQREPLLADPLALAGLDAAEAGDGTRAEQLMLAARKRDLRSPLVRFWLFDHFVRTGQYDRALDEVGPAIRLQPDALTALMTVLAAMADTPEGSEALARKLGTQPFWRSSFFHTAATNSAPQALLTLLSELPNASRATDEQREVFNALIASGNGPRAYQLWRRYLPAAYRSQDTVIYDGNFSKLPGAAPFNWTLVTDDQVGTARMVRAADLPQASTLDVHYFGSAAGVMAQQYVYMQPGAYRLQFFARSRNTSATGGQLGMELVCLNGNTLAALPLAPLGGGLRPFSTSVQVPAGCEMVRVQLVGTPVELFSDVEAQVTGVSLLRSE